MKHWIFHEAAPQIHDLPFWEDLGKGATAAMFADVHKKAAGGVSDEALAVHV